MKHSRIEKELANKRINNDIPKYLYTNKPVKLVSYNAINIRRNKK